MKDNKIIVFAGGDVGFTVINFLVKNHKNDLLAVVLDNNISLPIETIEIIGEDNILNYNNSKKDELSFFLHKYEIDYIILAWWAYILKEPIIKLPKVGVLNFHPSFLPYNRGKNYNFWTIVEDCPFGVTIHFVDIGIDTGDIIFQEQIYKTWEDNGKTLYVKAQQAIINLFIKNYNNIITGNYQRQQQNLTEGSFHTAKELDMASIIDLNKTYTAKELINLIRARTFEPHPSCWFDDNGEKFEIRVQISKVSQN